MRSFTTLSPTLLLLSAGLALHAAESTPDTTAPAEAATIVVTATRDDADRQTVPTNVGVVTSEDLREEGHPARLQDQLRGISGLAISQNFGGFAGGGGIYVRGARAHQTQVMFDGVPFNDPAAGQGQVGHHLFVMPGLGRIELAKGAQSGIYGSGASGGALNLIGLEPGTTNEGTGRVEYGTFDTFAYDVNASGPLSKDGRLSFVAAANGLVSDGFSAQASYAADGDPDGFEDDAFRRNGFFGKVQWSDGDSTVFASILRQTANESYDSTGPDDTAAKVDLDSLRLQGGGRVQLAEAFRVDADIAYSTYDREYTSSGVYDSKDLFTSGRAIFTPSDLVELTLGLDNRRQRMETDTINERATITGLWGQATADWAGLHPHLVVRRDQHSEEGDATTYRVGLSYGLFDDRWVLHGATGTGFRAPSLYELYSQYGNTALKPEETATYELGQRILLDDGAFRFEQTAFYTHFQEAIVWTADSTPVFGHYQNVSPDERAFVRGIEHELEWRPMEDLRISATATVQDSDDGAGDGKQMTFTPKTTGSLEVHWRFRVADQPCWITPGLDHLGTRWQDSANTVELENLTTLRLAVGWEPTEQVTVYARADNLTDEREATYISMPSMFGPGSTYSSTPRTFTVGAEARF